MDGILLVDKPTGPTSHDVVSLVKRQFRLEKVGHTGTLDPIATGLLVLTLGKATKLTEKLTAQSKDYVTTLLLGMTSDTQDVHGKILSQAGEVRATEKQVRDAISSFKGEQEQIPPMFSAVKQNGKKLYELARKGQVVERQPKKITLFDIQIREMNLPRISIFVSCSKGTYIRTLCHDIGEKLGCGGVMYSLRRTRLGPFEMDQARPLRDLLEADPYQFSSWVIPLSKLEEYAPAKTV